MSNIIVKIIVLLSILFLGILSCRDYNYFPDMANSLALQPQQKDQFFQKRFMSPIHTVRFNKRSEKIKTILKEKTFVLSIKEGRVLYNTYCAVCHGIGARGNGQMKSYWMNIPDLIGSKKKPARAVKRSEIEIYQIITNGFLTMQPLKSNIEEKNRKQIAHYVKWLQNIK